MSSNESFDVVVLGSGIGGLSAALAAYEFGLRTVLIEKSDRLGGGTTNSYGLIWVGGNHLQLAAGLKDDRKNIVDYLRFLGGGEANEDRLLAYVDHAPGAIKQFTDWGVSLRLVKGVTDHYFGMAPGASTEGRTLEANLISGHDLGPWKDRIEMPDDVPTYVTAEEQVTWGGMNKFCEWDQNVVQERLARDMRGKGVGLVCHFVKALQARTVPIRTGQRVARLAFNGKRVTGVEMAGGGSIEARKAVVLATGGYDWNVGMAKQFEGFPEVVSIGPRSLTGDGIVLAAEIGAPIHRIQNSLYVMLGFTIPSEDPAKPPVSCRAGIVELFSPHTMIVNRFGKRFADESFFQGIVPSLRQFDTLRHEYVNLPCFLIFDRQYLEKFSFGGRPAGAPVPSTVPRADSLVELAGKLGIDAGPFLETVERFNGFARTGIDQDFHRGELKWRLAAAKDKNARNPALGTIERGPFYGVKLLPSIGGSAGLLTNRHAQVMHLRERPIPGLYATGIVAVRDEGGVGYQAGATLAAAMTFSYLAIQHMTRQ
ncbi:MAG: FAD-binding protein [Alphaproteobacteria bacterium]|nr:FAD-binding protein [Alphaproteobacteria bacterium]